MTVLFLSSMALRCNHLSARSPPRVIISMSQRQMACATTMNRCVETGRRHVVGSPQGDRDAVDLAGSDGGENGELLTVHARWPS